MQISYQDMTKITGRSIQQLRRCVLIFLGIDHNTGRQSGICREFSITEGFIIYLMGIIVDECNCKLKEAKQIVEHIMINKKFVEIEKIKEIGDIPEINISIIKSKHISISINLTNCIREYMGQIRNNA